MIGTTDDSRIKPQIAFASHALHHTTSPTALIPALKVCDTPDIAAFVEFAESILKRKFLEEPAENW